MPCSRSNALIRLLWAVCSLTSRSRSRLARRASSCSTLGTCTIRTTRGSPRRCAIKRAQQQLAVDPVRLRAPPALLHRNAGGVKHEVHDPGRQQQPVQPEAVIAGLVAAHDPNRRAQLLLRPAADLLDQGQQPGMIAALQLVTRNPVPVRAVQRHQPALLAEFDCNENCATIVGGGRVYGRCLHLTLRWFECGNPNLSEKPRSPPHGIYVVVLRSRSRNDA